MDIIADLDEQMSFELGLMKRPGSVYRHKDLISPMAMQSGKAGGA